MEYHLSKTHGFKNIYYDESFVVLNTSERFFAYSVLLHFIAIVIVLIYLSGYIYALQVESQWSRFFCKLFDVFVIHIFRNFSL